MSGSGEGFTVRLNRLFETVCNSDGKPFTNIGIVSRMTADGYGITAGYISQLRNGARLRPSIVHIEGLARAFGVSPAYFFNAASPYDKDLDIDNSHKHRTDTLMDADAKLMAMRTAQLSEEGRRQVLLLVDEIRQREADQRQSDGH